MASERHLLPLPPVTVTIDSRARLPLAEIDPNVLRAIQREFTHTNPLRKRLDAQIESLQKAQRSGKSINKQLFGRLYGQAKNEQPTIETWQVENGIISVPRGGTSRLVEVLENEGFDPSFVDNRIEGSGERGKYTLKVEPWPFQKEIVDSLLPREQGMLRAPTGSGKTIALLMLLLQAGVPALVVVWTASLLDQWVRQLQEKLGLREREIGIVGQGVDRIRPITVGMQQTIRNRLPELVPLFGFVGCDECFEGSSPVLMEDGSIKSIREIEIGDRVALGGEVLRTFRRVYEGRLYRVGDAWGTAGHPIATDKGWIVASDIRDDDFLWYISKDELQDLREEDQVTQQAWDLQELQDEWSATLRSGDGSMSILRGGRSQGEEGATRQLEVWNRRPLEQGPYRGAGSEDLCVCGQGEGAEATRDIKEDAGGVDRSSTSQKVGGRTFSGTEESFRSTRGTGAEQGEGEQDDQGGEGCAVRGSSLWKWEGPDSERSNSSRMVEGRRLRTTGSGSDWACQADALQVGLGSSKSEDCGGNRREQSSGGSPKTSRCLEGLLPDVAGLAGASLPGARRLRRGSSKVHRSSVDSVCEVWNLETETGVYLAGGVLVHNCHKFAANTFREVVDHFPARYRYGVSADERRKDGKTFLLADTFGEVEASVDKDSLIEAGIVLDVEVRIIETGFACPWYERMAEEQRGSYFNELLDALIQDPERNALIASLVLGETKRNEQVLVFSHRVEHCRRVAADVAKEEPRVGLLLGGQDNRAEFRENVDRILDGKLRVGVGTYQAIGTGNDLPSVARGIATTPIHNNAPFLGQVMGRLCRTSQKTGKTDAILFYLWDRRIHGLAPVRRLAHASKKARVQVGDGWMLAKEFLAQEKAGGAR